jgi:UDP-GlcNAc:undecaprenyl-phosphate/decaprenyl-phosphate GlcNAc-1-phosphate transferase
MTEALQTSILLAPVIAFAVACLAQRGLLASPVARYTLDHPNHRSLHRQPTPRTGGIALVLGIAAGWLWYVLSPAPMAPWLPALASAGLGLAIVSLLDDLRGLSASLRLLAHFVACAGFLVALGGSIDEIEWLLLLLLLPMVWGVNLYNFMDGVDGLAGGMTVLGFGAYAVLAALQGSVTLAMLSSCVAAAALGFLPYNLAPAKVFLGDVGSIPLGFLAGALGVAGWHGSLWPLWLPPIVFSPFILDATLTLMRRLARGARPAEAHREHYYQRLAQLGYGHFHTALLEYALMLLSGAVGVVCVLDPGWLPLAVVLLVVELACFAAVDRAWLRHRAQNGHYQQQGVHATRK